MRRAAAFDRLEAAAHAGHPEAVRELADELPSSPLRQA